MKSNILLATLLVTFFSVNAQTKFYQGSLTDAMEIAAAEKRYLFIDCYTDWCGWCKVADEKTFPNEEVGDMLMSNFIPVKLDMERGDGIELGARYRVFGYPSYLIFTPDGRFARKMSGYMSDPMDFVSELKSALDESSHPNYPVKLNEPVKLPEFYLKSFANADSKEKRVNPEPELVEKWLSEHDDLTSIASWSVFSKFQVNDKINELFLSDREKFESIYGSAEVQNKVGSIAYAGLRLAIDKKSEEGLNEVLGLVKQHMTENIEENLNFYRLQFYEGTENWPAYVDVVQSIILAKGIEGQSDAINNYCWTIYLHVDDKDLLKLSLKWMDEVVRIDPEYMYLDTYAALLFKSHRYKEAAKWAQTAIETGKKYNQDVAETEVLLEKIQTELKGK